MINWNKHLKLRIIMAEKVIKVTAAVRLKSCNFKIMSKCQIRTIFCFLTLWWHFWVYAKWFHQPKTCKISLPPTFRLRVIHVNNHEFSCNVFYLTASERSFVLLALKRLGDIYHVHSDSSFIVIYCISVLLPLATGFILTWQGRGFLQSVGIFMFHFVFLGWIGQNGEDQRSQGILFTGRMLCCNV